jgi:hypothetical protein
MYGPWNGTAQKMFVGSLRAKIIEAHLHRWGQVVPSGQPFPFPFPASNALDPDITVKLERQLDSTFPTYKVNKCKGAYSILKIQSRFRLQSFLSFPLFPLLLFSEISSCYVGVLFDSIAPVRETILASRFLYETRCCLSHPHTTRVRYSNQARPAKHTRRPTHCSSTGIRLPRHSQRRTGHTSALFPLQSLVGARPHSETSTLHSNSSDGSESQHGLFPPTLKESWDTKTRNRAAAEISGSSHRGHHPLHLRPLQKELLTNE